MTIDIFVTRCTGSAQAILTDRLQTESEAHSWEYLGTQKVSPSAIPAVCAGILRDGQYMAVRAFRVTRNCLSGLVCAKVHPEVK